MVASDHMWEVVGGRGEGVVNELGTEPEALVGFQDAEKLPCPF